MESVRQPSPSLKVRWSLRAMAVGLGVFFAWTSRFSANPDAICYFDIADGFRLGGWSKVVSGIWCPLYPALLALARFLLKPSLSSEVPVAHLVNFVVYLAALAGFEFLLDQLKRHRESAAREGSVLLPEWAWLSLAYTGFFYGVLGLIQLMTVTSDLCVGAAVFWSAGLIARIQSGDGRFRTFLWLGFVLGLGYLSKTAMFFLGHAFLLIAGYAAWPQRRTAARVASGLAVFWLTMSLFIVPLSRAKHRFTFAEIGPMKYAWTVLAIKDFPAHPEGIPGVGAPRHPYEVLFDKPRVYGYFSHLAGTYSPAFYSIYWYDGMKVKLDWRQQLRSLGVSLRMFGDLFAVEWSFALGLLLLCRYSSWKAHWIKRLASERALILMAFTAFAAFSLMEAEGRYVGAYVAVLLTAVASAIRVPDKPRVVRTLRPIVLLMLLGPGIYLGHSAGSFVKDEWFWRRGKEIPYSQRHAMVAQTLRDAGVPEGAPVGFIGDSDGALWARLARVRVAADAEAGQFWAADPRQQKSALNGMRQRGIRAVVGYLPLALEPGPGWQRIGRTNYLVYLPSLSR